MHIILKNPFFFGEGVVAAGLILLNSLKLNQQDVVPGYTVLTRLSKDLKKKEMNYTTYTKGTQNKKLFVPPERSS